MSANDLRPGQQVRALPLGSRRNRVLGTITKLQNGWLVWVETRPDRNDHTRTVICDASNVEVLS